MAAYHRLLKHFVNVIWLHLGVANNVANQASLGLKMTKYCSKRVQVEVVSY